MSLISEINNQFNSETKIFKIYCVEYNKSENILTIRVHYLVDGSISLEIKQSLAKFIKDYLSFNGEVVVKAKKYYIDEKAIFNLISDFIIHNYPNINNILSNQIILKKENDTYNCIIEVNESIYNYIISNNITEVLQNYLESIIFDTIKISYSVKNISNSNILDEKKNIMLSQFTPFSIKEIRTIEFTIKDKVIGEFEDNTAIFISDLNSECDNVAICGKLNYFTKNTFKKNKTGSDGKTSEIEKDYYTFQINDNSGSIRCVYFPKIADVEKVSKLENVSSIAVIGSVTKNGDQYNCKVKNIAIIEDLPIININNEVIYNSSPENYTLIFPKKFTDISQQNLFVEDVKYNDFVMNNTFVVFDLETTGINYSTEEITEIGAVKIEKGEITQIFQTLVKPNKSISAEITKITNIDDDLVKDAPSISQVLPDFYKFCDNSIIIAYNIDFDYKFINYYGLKQNYKFSNRQIDAMVLARNYIVGLKNYKLKSVVEKLNIINENAHRALSDAIATAKVFLKLSNYITS